MYTARHLRRRLRRDEAVVTLVEPRGFMTFQPFLAEAAAGTIEPRHAVTSLRRVLRGTEVLSGRITGSTTMPGWPASSRGTALRTC